jgi:hypothetical protein
MWLGPGILAALLLAVPAAADDTMCFDGSELERRTGPQAAPSPEEAASVLKALDGVASYRACVSYASLFHGFARATVEFTRPNLTRIQVRHRPHRGEAGTLEAVTIGGDTWYRTGPRWERLPAGQKLADAVPKVFLPPEPIEMVRSFIAERAQLVRTGESRGRAGPCAVWDNPKAPGGVKDVFCFGLADHLPYRYSGGGPTIEAYLQLELYDFGVKLEIRSPQ